MILRWFLQFHPCRKFRERHFEKRIDFYARISHLLEEMLAGAKATYMVVDDSDFYSLYGFEYQYFADFVPNRVVVEYVELDVDAFGCIFQVFFEAVEKFTAVSVDIDCIVREIDGSRQGVSEPDLLAAFIG